jgi:uncharacterized protein YggE
MRNTRLLATLCVALLVCLAAGAAHAAKQPGAPRTISTTGESTVYVRPDEVVINLGVETFNKDLPESKAANDAASKKLLSAIRGVGVEDKYVQADVMQVQIDYADGGAKNGIDGYYCRRAYAVTLKDVKLFENVIDTALGNGANYLMGFEFRTTELRKHRDQARKMAIKAAREKADALCGELDMTVGTPHTISEGAIGYWGYQGGWWGWSGRGSYMSQNVIQQAPSAGGGEGGETLPLGQIAVRATVSVTFDMTPATAPTTSK